ncbi:TadE family protein [Paenibacillus sp. FSL H7-0716]|uniref:Pilus assembly protein TadE n=1 Tax=Paenibacillus odorifer TaxID=189426 RepID=A0AAD0KJT3_9BACL|nr:TadE family protein [Paenibacillus odorifer]AWV32163.1 pilus assembly protein TadE [Paenibacillus odorifer]OME14559.1 pilus assembly protein TadE [Paenibacillus odorifer]
MNKLKGDQGSFTIEASLLLPIVMFITMLLLFFCLYSYQKSMLLQVASGATERAAYNWDNSHKEVSGSYMAGEYDSLYWRIGDDALLTSLFGGEAGSAGVTIELPGEVSEKSDLPVLKLGHSSTMIPDNMPGTMRYTHNLTGRRVNAELNRLLSLPVLDSVLADEANPTVKALSIIVEPVEFIRTVDLMRYFGAKFKGGSEGSESAVYMDKKDASAMLTKLQDK